MILVTQFLQFHPEEEIENILNVPLTCEDDPRFFELICPVVERSESFSL